MRIIAIDASGVAGSVAYMKDGQLIGEYYICHKLTHSETIMPMLEHLKELIGIELEEVDAIAVTSGPGSFTGLRIGVATAKAMALALNIPVIGVPTLDVIAHNMVYTEHMICPIMDARRNQVYTSLYKWNEEELERLRDHEAIDMQELLDQIEPLAGSVIFVGDGIEVFRGQITDRLGERAKFAPSFLKMQRASTLGHIACSEYEKGNVQDADLFAPIYLRKSQAERELEEREAREN